MAIFKETVKVQDNAGTSDKILLVGEGTTPGVTVRDGGSLYIQTISDRRSVEIDGARGHWNVYDDVGRRALALRCKEVGGTGAGLWLGGNTADSVAGATSPGPKAGFLSIRDNAGKDNIIMDGLNGQVTMRNAAGKGTIFMDGLNGILYLTGKVIMRNAADKDSIVIDGPSGDIVLKNADCAEDFDVLHPTVVDPGTVMVIEQEGKLKECDAAYDKRVAGVISGAGDYKPGLVLDKRKSIGNRKSISLMGKVHCKVDAQSAPIEVGDLLTTSSTAGHAMKAADPRRAFGSVIGKALRPLKAGKGLIPILIALQ